jgi:saccharopine dehydrogenase-like NADP-dependent oxidoreductase
MEFLLNKSLIQKTRSSASTNNPISIMLAKHRVDPKETLKELKKLLKSSSHLADQTCIKSKFRGLKDERRGISSRQGCRSSHQTITTTQRKEF